MGTCSDVSTANVDRNGVFNSAESILIQDAGRQHNALLNVQDISSSRAKSTEDAVDMWQFRVERRISLSLFLAGYESDYLCHLVCAASIRV